MQKKRYLAISSFIICLFLVLEGRLAQIQLMDTESFSKHHVNLIKESVSQRTQEMVIDDGRGQFIDRNGETLTSSEKPVLILFPFLKNIEWDAGRVSRLLNVSETKLRQAVKEHDKPFVFGGKTPFMLTESQFEKINALKEPGVFAVNRKTQSFTASQLIGLTGEDPKTFLERYPSKKGQQNEKIGINGLQRQFDEFLLPENESKLVYHVDGFGNPLFGMDVKYTGPANPFYPVEIQTTIDKNIQEQIESLADQYQIKRGGVLLLDIKSNEILANVSRPKLNSADPFSNDGTINMMTSEQIPGSIFKTVTAAASIETGIVSSSEKFSCNENLYGKPDIRQLGNLNFQDSFAESCNRTFGELAKRLKRKSPDLLEEYAKRLGLIGGTAWKGPVYHIEDFLQFKEDSGRVFLPHSKQQDDNAAAQTGIGQKEVRVTPLAAANMMATIARGGKKEMVRAVTSIKYQDGTTMVHFPNKKAGGNTISKITAMRLQQMLRKVVTSNQGTGKWFQSLPVKVAGKSGTAETGIYKNNIQLHNKWFAGYFPYNDPQYALVVVKLGVNEEEEGPNPLFSDIVKMLCLKKQQSREF